MENSSGSTAELVWRSITSLDSWLELHGLKGYDPYDLKGTRLILNLTRMGDQISLPLRLFRKILLLIADQWPLFTRQLMGVEKEYNPKGMGLFAKAYLDLFQATGLESYKEKALFCLKWLEDHPSPGFSGYCWGYPFDWQSAVFIPEGTPSAVVSAVVGDAFWRAYQVLNETRYLEICDSICQFFIKDLQIDEMESGSICFSYTPVDDFHVHNANLFVAEFLIRIGKEQNQEEYLSWGERAAAYALQEQNPDGSLYYWGKVQDHHSPRHLDHYHSGFEIRSLYSIKKLTGDPVYQKAVARYYDFYLKNFINQTDGTTRPNMKPGEFYPVDIHSCAEALLCNSMLADEFPEARNLLAELSAWTLETMQTGSGWFIYRILQEKGKEQRIEIPYMRWGQAWMLNALASYYLILTRK